MQQVERVIIIVLDSLGIGAAPDAKDYGDAGSNTLGNVARAVGGLKLPHLEKMGLGNLVPVAGVPPVPSPIGGWGRMQPASAGKDTITGHWELAGVVLANPFPLYPQGFPEEIISAIEKSTDHKLFGNVNASGMEIIERLGKEHLRTGKLIVYTSGDSVMQIAAHESVISTDELYKICCIAREILQGKHAVGRVIARPFRGTPGHFQRTAHRKDFALEPPVKTILDRLQEQRQTVIGIGKIGDIFAGRGLDYSVTTSNNKDGMAKTLEIIKECNSGLLFVNLVDFDMNYGHRNDPFGYGQALVEFDRFLPELQRAMAAKALLIITADHGCDPTISGTDHTREYVPLLIAGTGCRSINLGTRKTFADVAATIACLFNIQWHGPGTSFADELIRSKEEVRGG